MRFVRMLLGFFRKMECSSIIIIKIGSFLCTAAYLAAAVLYIIVSAGKTDFTTGLYWIIQFSLLGGRLMLACTIPVFIAELYYSVHGYK